MRAYGVRHRAAIGWRGCWVYGCTFTRTAGVRDAAAVRLVCGAAAQHPPAPGTTSGGGAGGDRPRPVPAFLACCTFII